MSKNMAEALARRNFEAEYDGLPWDELPDSAKQGWVNEAQATIDFLSAAGFGLVADTKAEAFTERQAKEWPRAVAEVQRHVDTSTVPLGLHDWNVQWEDETRPGRGHLFDGTWTDGEYFAQVRMDVYGYASVAIAETTWVHNSSDEECDCYPCETERNPS